MLSKLNNGVTMRTLNYFLFALVLLTLAPTAVAGFDTYSDRSAWQNSTGATQTENFDSIVVDTDFHPNPLTFGSGLSLQAPGNAGNNFIDVVPISSEVDVDGTAVASIFNGQSDLPLLPSIRFAGPVSAFGADFRSLQDSVVRTQFELRLNGVVVGTIEPNVISEITLRFFGFTANAGETFDEIVVLRINNDVFGMDYAEWSSVDQGQTMPVPALAPFGLIILLLGVVFLSTRRLRA